MGKSWTVNSTSPAKEETYEWRLPANDQQHVEETVAPGDLKIKPKDISLIPTLAPKKSGVQSGLSDWTFSSVPDSKWYVRGEIIQD